MNIFKYRALLGAGVALGAPGAPTHSKCAVSMAGGPTLAAPARSSLVLGGAPWLGGQCTVFGAVTEGHGVAGRLAAVDLGGGSPSGPRTPRLGYWPLR